MKRCPESIVEHLASHASRLDQVAERVDDVAGLDRRGRAGCWHASLRNSPRSDRSIAASAPGAMPLTRMPCGASARAASSVSAGQRLLRQGVAEIVGIGRGELGIEQVDDRAHRRPARARARSARSGARAPATLTAMCASNSSALNSPKPSHAKRAALLTSRPHRAARPAAAKMTSAQSGSARSATTLIAPPANLVLGMVDMRDDRPAVAEQRLGEMRRRRACRRRSRWRFALSVIAGANCEAVH